MKTVAHPGDAGSPTVTIAIRSFNGEAYIEQALDSACAQTYGCVKIMVVDDGSTDDTAQIVRRSPDRRIRLVEHKRNLGRTAAIKTAIAEVDTPWLAFLDSDDIARPEWIERLIEIADRDSSLVGIGCQLEQIDEHGISKGVVSAFPADHPQILNGLLMAPSVTFGGAMWSSAALRAIDFNPSFDVAEDYLLLTLLALDGGKFENSELPLMLYRQHDRQSKIIESEETIRAHMAVVESFVLTLWPAIDPARLLDITEWVSWHRAGRGPRAVKNRDAMTRSLRVTRWIDEHPPAVLPKRTFSSYRKRALHQELVAWGGVSSFGEVWKARREISNRAFLRSAVRSVAHSVRSE
ncbi:glycosyltransferase family 2 protein [Brachybacterium sp. DNPG3]